MTDNIEDEDSEFDDENLDEIEEEVEEVQEELKEAEEELEKEIENGDFDDEDEEEFEEEEEAPGFADVSSDDDEEDDEDEEDFDKPVSEGEIVEIEVEDLGSKGDGIARVEGFVVFVPGGEVGKSYDVEITSVGRKFAFAEIEDEV